MRACFLEKAALPLFRQSGGGPARAGGRGRGGGGHRGPAGATVDGTLDEAKAAILAAYTEVMG